MVSFFKSLFSVFEFPSEDHSFIQQATLHFLMWGVLFCVVNLMWFCLFSVSLSWIISAAATFVFSSLQMTLFIISADCYTALGSILSAASSFQDLDIPTNAEAHFLSHTVSIECTIPWTNWTLSSCGLDNFLVSPIRKGSMSMLLGRKIISIESSTGLVKIDTLRP